MATTMAASSPASSPASTACLVVRVQGRVQGVGYRWSCVRKAGELGVAGWVRNRADGSVEALLQGPRDRLDGMCAWMRGDVPGALVTSMDVTEAPDAPASRGFEQRPTI